jgi:drug/metabolite transporter (DMT)-like permease
MSQERIVSRSAAYLSLTFGAVCISFAPVFVKAIGAQTMGLTAMGCWRTAFGGVFLFLLTRLYKRPLTLPWPAMRWSILAGFIFFLDLTVWHRSIEHAGAGLATILGNTQVFGTAVLSFLIFKERLSLRFIIAAVSAVFGVAMLVGVLDDITFTESYIRGIIFGLLTGIAYALYLITLKRTGREKPPPDFMTFVAWTSVFSAIFLGLGSTLEERPFMPDSRQSLMYLVMLGIIVQGAGWLAIYRSLSVIDASKAGLILLLQPILATVWGILMFGEELALMQAVGAVITLAAIYFGSLPGRRPKMPPT